MSQKCSYQQIPNIRLGNKPKPKRKRKLRTKNVQYNVAFEHKGKTCLVHNNYFPSVVKAELCLAALTKQALTTRSIKNVRIVTKYHKN